MKRQILHTRLITAAAFAACTLLLTGCDSGQDAASDATDGATASAALPDGIILDAAPEGAKSVSELKASAEEGDEVVVRVIVGGRMDPIVEGRASAIAIDAAVDNACTGDDDHCKTPWDYCCTPKEELNANMATVQIVDEKGRVVAADLSEHFQPLSTLVVKGVVGPRPDANVLPINASGIYVEPNTP